MVLRTGWTENEDVVRHYRREYLRRVMVTPLDAGPETIER